MTLLTPVQGDATVSGAVARGNMPFEKFHSGAGRPSQEPAVSIQPSGVIRLNAKVVEFFKREKITHVVLMWDKDKHRLAIEPETGADAAAYRVTFNPRSNSATIGSKAFGSFIGWAADRSVKVLAKMGQGG